MLGVFGVASYSVRQRTVEIGTRMALGATNQQVLSLVIGRGLKMAGFGVVAGGVAAVAASLYLRGIFKIDQLEPAPFLYSTAIVAGTAFAASFLPAWRAAFLSPMVAIRNEPDSMLTEAGLRAKQVLSK